MEKKVISCEFNIDTACVEAKFADGNRIAIDCTLVEAEVARNMYESSELEWLVYNAPANYANLLLHGDVYEIFKVQLWVNDTAPFLRNGKCRRLSSHWLDGRLHFAWLYYITLGAGVNSLESGCDVDQ